MGMTTTMMVVAMMVLLLSRPHLLLQHLLGVQLDDLRIRRSSEYPMIEIVAKPTLIHLEHPPGPKARKLRRRLKADTRRPNCGAKHVRGRHGRNL